MEDFGKITSMLKTKKTFSDDSQIDLKHEDQENMFDKSMKSIRKNNSYMRKTTMAVPGSTKNSPLKSFSSYETQIKQAKTEKQIKKEEKLRKRHRRFLREL